AHRGVRQRRCSDMAGRLASKGDGTSTSVPRKFRDGMERAAGAAADRIRHSPLFRIMPIMSLTTCAIALIGLGRHSHRETRWLQTVRHPRYSPWRTRDRNIVSWIGQAPSGAPDSPRDAALR